MPRKGHLLWSMQMPYGLKRKRLKNSKLLKSVEFMRKIVLKKKGIELLKHYASRLTGKKSSLLKFSNDFNEFIQEKCSLKDESPVEELFNHAFDIWGECGDPAIIIYFGLEDLYIYFENNPSGVTFKEVRISDTEKMDEILKEGGYRQLFKIPSNGFFEGEYANVFEKIKHTN